MIEADVIEPWDNYIPKDVLDDIIPSIREENTIDGKLYGWPFLLDVIGNSLAFGPDDQGRPARRGPRDLGRAPGQCQGDRRFRRRAVRRHLRFAWLALARADDAQHEQRCLHVGGPVRLHQRRRDRGVDADEEDHGAVASRHPARGRVGRRRQRHAGRGRLRRPARRLLSQVLQRAAAHGRRTGTIRSFCIMGPLPKFANGEGSTVFWTTGCALFKHGKNKEKAAEYIKALTYDPQIWKDSIAGTESGHPGQLPPYKSIYAEWDANKPDWMPDFVGAGPRPARQGQGDHQPHLRPAAVRHRQARLGDLSQGRGGRSEGGHAEGHRGGPGRDEARQVIGA